VIDARRHWLVIPGVPGPRLLGALNDALDANQARAGAEEEDLVGESGTLAGGALQANVPRDAGVASPALRPVEGVSPFRRSSATLTGCWGGAGIWTITSTPAGPRPRRNERRSPLMASSGVARSGNAEVFTIPQH
jgi:hypothetical protein